MSTARIGGTLVLGTFAFCLMQPTITAGEPWIRLEGLPERLTLPAPEGTNLVLTTTVKGAEVESVWLGPAKDKPSSDRVTLTRSGEDQFQVNLASGEVYDLLKDHTEDGEFRVYAALSDGGVVKSVAVTYALHVLPERLDFPWDEAIVTVSQRNCVKLPGACGSLRVCLGDITRAQVLVWVYPRDRDTVVAATSMRKGDTISLPTDAQDYVLRVERLVNLLAGQDYAVLSVVGPRVSGLLVDLRGVLP